MQVSNASFRGFTFANFYIKLNLGIFYAFALDQLHLRHFFASKLIVRQFIDKVDKSSQNSWKVLIGPTQP